MDRMDNIVTPDVRVRRMLERLRQHGHRVTPQRLAVLRVLASNHDHPSAEQIHQALAPSFPNMSLATVYKTLTLLKQAGQVLELGFSHQDNRYDGRKPYPHPHVVCTGCGAVVDPSFLDLEGITRAMGAETGFQITAHRLDFYGRCPACQKDKNK